MLSYNISKKYGEAGLPENTIVIHAKGSGGQSFSAFGANGITFDIEGDANDYFGKGLSGAKLMIYPPKNATFVPEENIIIGNVALYGAIRGEAYIRGLAGERFAVRNSGAKTVVEGVGDHGCEYMTGGIVVVLGRTGRNFAAGMSGGIAYVLDEQGDFEKFRCNKEMVALESLSDAKEIEHLRHMIENHQKYTGSTVAKRILDTWAATLPKFIKIMPTDYKKALEKMAKEKQAEILEGESAGELEMAGSK
jgi:glutamate synthase (ferredoxin)